jgi:hypothetical protein
MSVRMSPPADFFPPAANFFPPAAAAHSLLQLTLYRLPASFSLLQGTARGAKADAESALARTVAAAFSSALF